MDLSGPGIDVKLKERKKEKPRLHLLLMKPSQTSLLLLDLLELLYLEARELYPLLISIMWDSTVLSLAKFRPETYDFNIFRDFHGKKITQIRQVLECLLEIAICLMRSSTR